MTRTQVALPVPEKHKIRNGVIVGLLLLVLYIVSSMVAPTTVPRLALLPRPPEVQYVKSATEGCPPYQRFTNWQRGIFWEKGPSFGFGDECMTAAR